MLRNYLHPLLLLGLFACFFTSRGSAQVAIPQPIDLLISVAEQRMLVLHEGAIVGKFRISTSRFGIGDSRGSYRTPLGHFRVCDKVGEGLPSGTVIKHRTATNEVLPVNAAGRDPIVTRIIWLDGQEEQNQNAKARGIYIHGTTEESRIGDPVSWGCIRMRSRDIIELFPHVSAGTQVMVITGKLPKLRKYVPAPPVLLASTTPAPRLTARAQAARTEYLPEIASAPGKIPGDPGAADAMKGSILSAGLPGGPEKADAQKQATMKFQSWSTVSVREADGSGRRVELR